MDVGQTTAMQNHGLYRYFADRPPSINLRECQNWQCKYIALDYNNIPTYSPQWQYNAGTVLLTHLPLDKMTANMSDDIFKCIFMNEKLCISIRISLKFVPRGPIDNRPALVQEMAWHRIRDKPLPEAMMNQLTDAYMRH